MKTKLFLMAFIVFAVLGCNPDTPNSPQEGTHKGHTYVDLGLSVKWATYNVGATKPEEAGDYFAFGETETKEHYDKYTHKWYDSSSNQLTKYCTSSEYGIVDNKTTLEPDDDAATVNWGGKWRIPTKQDWDELLMNSVTYWCSYNGVYGYKITSVQNGNSIFLPAAGKIQTDEMSFKNEYGFYRTSTLDTEEDPGGLCAYYFIFNSKEHLWSGDSRPWGIPIRAVCP